MKKKIRISLIIYNGEQRDIYDGEIPLFCLLKAGGPKQAEISKAVGFIRMPPHDHIELGCVNITPKQADQIDKSRRSGWDYFQRIQ